MKVVRTILFIINVMLALGLVLTTLAGVVEPSRTILPSLLAFAYGPMLVANVAMVAVWLLMRRWEVLLPVAAIAVRWAMVPLMIQVCGTAKVPPLEEHPYRMTLMTYNIHQFKGNGIDTVQADSVARCFVGLVRNEEPDVLCLQEFAAVKGVNVVDSLTTMGYNHYYGARTSRAGMPYGTVVFAKHPITYVKKLDDEKVLVELMCEGQRMRVVCLHMDSYRFDDDDLAAMERMRHGEGQEEGRRTMGKIKETILSHEEEWNKTVSPVVGESTVPTVLAGDLNDIPTSWLHHQISKHMTDTYTEQGSGLSTTYSLRDTGTPISAMSFRIDAVFRSEGLRTLSYKRIKTRLSDHYPILVALEFEI